MTGAPVTFFRPPEPEKPESPPPGPVRVDARARALLLPEVADLAERIGDPALRAAYEMLRDGLTDGDVPEVAVTHLENLLEMGLQTGRFRRQHGPEGVILLNRLYHQTPRGKEMSAAAAGVNTALGELSDHVIESVSIRSTAPGSYELTLLTDRCEMVVGISPGGLRVVSVLAGG